MKETFAVARKLLRLGVLRVDVEGHIWKEQEIRNTGARVPITPRRAEAETSNGYLQVVMRDGARQYTEYAHRIVWTWFKGSIPKGLDINHMDGDKKNNAPRNLELVTRGENHRHAFRTGLRTIPWALPESKKLEARALRVAGQSYSQIAKALGIGISTAYRAVKAG